MRSLLILSSGIYSLRLVVDTFVPYMKGWGPYYRLMPVDSLVFCRGLLTQVVNEARMASRDPDDWYLEKDIIYHV